jgi:hypothetical protein
VSDLTGGHGVASAERHQWRFRCTTASCSASTLFAEQLPVEPAVRDGALVCPLCAHPLTRAGRRARAIGVELRHLDAVKLELVVEQGVGLTIGRWGGDGAFPIDDVLGAGPASSVSRRHLRLDLSPSGLWALDLGSVNGTSLVLGPSRHALSPTATHLVPDGAVIVLPGAIVLAPLSEAVLPRPHALSSADLTSDKTSLDGRADA